MKRIHLAVLAAAGLCVATATPAAAQGLRYGVNAGLLMPMGDYNSFDKPGWVAGAGATYWLKVCFSRLRCFRPRIIALIAPPSWPTSSRERTSTV